MGEEGKMPVCCDNTALGSATLLNYLFMPNKIRIYMVISFYKFINLSYTCQLFKLIWSFVNILFLLMKQLEFCASSFQSRLSTHGNLSPEGRGWSPISLLSLIISWLHATHYRWTTLLNVGWIHQDQWDYHSKERFLLTAELRYKVWNGYKMCKLSPGMLLTLSHSLGLR